MTNESSVPGSLLAFDMLVPRFSTPNTGSLPAYAELVLVSSLKFEITSLFISLARIAMPKPYSFCFHSPDTKLTSESPDTADLSFCNDLGA